MAFAPNNNANPTGKNGRSKGYQLFKERLEHWCCNSTIDEIKAIAEAGYKGRNPIDAGVLRFIYHALTLDGNSSLNDLFDRLVGKSTQEIKTVLDATINDDRPVSQASQLLRDISASLEGRGDKATTTH